MSKCPDNYWWDININVSFLTHREVMVTEEPVLSWFQNFRNFTNLFQSFPFWMENWSDFSSWENHFSLNFLSCHCDKDILTNCGEKKETWLYCNGHLMYLSIFSLLLLVFLSSCIAVFLIYWHTRSVVKNMKKGDWWIWWVVGGGILKEKPLRHFILGSPRLPLSLSKGQTTVEVVQQKEI